MAKQKYEQNIMKKLIYAAMLLLGLGMMVSCGGNGQGKTENKEITNTETQEAAPVEEAEPVDTRPRVYACAYDAFVNIRETPEAKAPILGVFRNGPDGAVLLGTEGEWTKIDCNGIVGYVLSKYVQNTPTVAYTGTATLDDIAGIYTRPGGGGLYLWEDGTWESGYNWANVYGYYILQNNEVKLVVTSQCVDANPDMWETIDDATAQAQAEILPIDLAQHKVGENTKLPFITQKDIENAKKEYEEEWEYMLYGDYPRSMTKEEFKRKGR